MKDIARKFAIKHHGNQKYGGHPYSVHLDAVAEIVKGYGKTACTIAYLHDVVEDTEISVSDIKKMFGKLVADSVAILTDEPGKDRKDRKAKTYSKMAAVSGKNEIALIVKAADRLANLESCIGDNNERLLRIYVKEYPVFKESVYRPGICDEIWIELSMIINTIRKTPI